MRINDIYVAEVRQNDSRLDIENPKADGRIQIFVKPIMSGWPLLPWARPFTSGPGVSMIPDVGDKVWVFCLRPKTWDEWYYLGIAEFKNNNPHNDIPLIYKDYRYVKWKGSFVAIGPTLHIEHKSGTIIKIDEQGKTTIKGGDVYIDGNNVNVKAQKVVIDSQDITLGQDGGKILTTVSDPVVDNITGAPHQGSSIIKGT